MQVTAQYKEVVIWYFSGTGNARFAADKIKANILAKGIPAQVHNIANYKEAPTSANKGTLIGFCYPTHGFNAPPNVLKFINNFPQGKANVFFLNTRAGLKLYKLHLPGIGGMALWLPALIMLFKGYRAIGFRPLDMPSNWILLHPGLRHKVVASIKDHCTKTLLTFTNRIIQGKPVLNGFLWLALDLVIIPVSLGYYFIGRFALAKSLYASTSCNNCGLCVKDCPVKAIIEKKGRLFWTFKCESCMHCLNLCPHRAIETAHGYLFLLWWLAFSYIPYIIMKMLVKTGLISLAFYNRYIDLIFYSIMTIVALVIIFYGYNVLHWLLQFKLMNKIITYTSLTHYKWWRRYRLGKHTNLKST
jgi:Pyruvate/2-oxoacid:ferredoxin oxidoreductase delta subunit